MAAGCGSAPRDAAPLDLSWQGMNRRFKPIFILFAGMPAAGMDARMANGQPASTTSRPVRVTVSDEPDALRREVMENLVNLPAGAGRVADFNLPQAFLGRVADRILTAAFEEQFRKIVAEGPGSQPSKTASTSRPTSRSASEAGVRVIRTHVSPESAALWRSWREDYPDSRGFRAPFTLNGARSETHERMLRETPEWPARFEPSMPGWRVAGESGETEIEGLHLQLTRGDDWLARGDGGCVDVARQLAAALPKARILASIEEKHLADFLSESATWKPRRTGETWALVSPMAVAQWAQDNCKFGWVAGDKGAAPVRVALAPRYPSRGEAGAVFVPGEAVVLQGLAECGVARVVQSPLLFQAGNLICVWDPAKKQHVLLIGEAEVYRNVALGLSHSQVLDAFRIEFGVDTCVVLPASSFHIDYEVSVRTVQGRVIALVNDEQAGAKLVLVAGIEALVRAGELSAEQGSKAARSIEDGRLDFAEALGPALVKASRGWGAFGQSFAEKFSRGPADSGIGNCQCFLRALDLWSLSRVELQPDAGDASTRAMLDALRRRAADRLTLQATLKTLGWHIAPVPSMGDSRRALNYLNGIHDRTRYFMPVYGGTFESVDRAAREAIERSLGPSVEIVPIRCAESQRREGSVRCSAAVMYAAQSVP